MGRALGAAAAASWTNGRFPLFLGLSQLMDALICHMDAQSSCGGVPGALYSFRLHGAPPPRGRCHAPAGCSVPAVCNAPPVSLQAEVCIDHFYVQLPQTRHQLCTAAAVPKAARRAACGGGRAEAAAAPRRTGGASPASAAERRQYSISLTHACACLIERGGGLSCAVADTRVHESSAQQGSSLILDVLTPHSRCGSDASPHPRPRGGRGAARPSGGVARLLEP